MSSGSSMSISSDGSRNHSSDVVIGATPSDARVPQPVVGILSISSLNLSNLSIAEVDTTVTTLPSSSTDVFQPGAVVKLMRASMRSTPRFRYYSYALYCGNGRVIHSWSNTRTNFRVRVDSLRSLQIAGITATDASEEMDAFCFKVFRVVPLAPGDVVERARQAVHCETRDRRSSVVLILHARYGDIAATMATSLLTIAPLVIKMYGLEKKYATGEITLGQALATVLHAIDPKNYQEPELIDVPAAERVVPTKAVIREKAARVRKIKGLLQSEVEPFLALWVMLALKKSDPRAPTVAVVVAQLKRARASLYFSPLANAFTIILTSDKNVLERLVRERMECGICFVNYNDVVTKLLECSHVLCGSCLASLRTRVCPYCRQEITFERQITTHYKKLANELIREEERLALEANDMDAPLFELIPTEATNESIEAVAIELFGRLRVKLLVRLAKLRALKAEREMAAMRNEDRDASTV